MKKWYKIEAKADKAEIWIYEAIGEDIWTGGGVTAKKFQKELAEIKASQIDLHINSPGGSVFDGVTIYNLIKQHPANVTTYIDGIAASIASVVALAGNTVTMAENAIYMIHNPFGGVMGNASDMRKFADVLDKIGGTMVSTYAEKTGKPDDEIRALMDEETWMTADEAMEFGFVDNISGALDMAACSKFVPVMSAAGFKNIPNDVFGGKHQPDERQIERALRDAGCTVKMAKTILANGFPDYRDGDQDEPEPALPPGIMRDADPPAQIVDRVARLMTRAEMLAPSQP
jgi:ATP-dependent Clp endopeptidase proteolytic subunit ClpP